MSSTFQRRRPRPPSTHDSSSSAPPPPPLSAAAESLAASPVSFSPFLQLPGTKAWTAGCVLVSTGLRDLDAIVLAATPGGQPLGSCILVLEATPTRGGRTSSSNANATTGWSILSDTLVRYWCAEALSQNQDLFIPVEPPQQQPARGNALAPIVPPADSINDEADENEAWDSAAAAAVIRAQVLDALPRNLHVDKQKIIDDQEKSSTAASATRLDTLTELGDDDEQEDSLDRDQSNDDDDDGLVVAWQYRKDIQQERLGVKLQTRRPTAAAAASVFCHSYDLQGRLADQIDVDAATTFIPIPTAHRWLDPAAGREYDDDGSFAVLDAHRRQCGYEFYLQMKRSIESRLKSPPLRVIRLLLYHSNVFVTAVALPLFLNFVRRNKLPVVVFMSVNPIQEQRGIIALSQLRRCADVVLECDAFATRTHYPPPPEISNLHGLLAVHRAATCTLACVTGHFADATVEKRPAANLYGIRRDERKLHISLLHIPPEDYAAHGSSVGSSAVRSGAGRSSNVSSGSHCGDPVAGQSPLDF